MFGFLFSFSLTSYVLLTAFTLLVWHNLSERTLTGLIVFGFALLAITIAIPVVAWFANRRSSEGTERKVGLSKQNATQQALTRKSNVIYLGPVNGVSGASRRMRVSGGDDLL